MSLLAFLSCQKHVLGHFPFFFFFFEIKVIWYIFYSLRATDCRAQPMMRETENMGRRLNRFCYIVFGWVDFRGMENIGRKTKFSTVWQ